MKKIIAAMCGLLLSLCLFSGTALANGNSNIDGGGGGLGQGTSSNKWSPGNDGVRVTVVDSQSGIAVSSSVDFSNRAQDPSMLHFGRVNKLQYRNGTSLSLQSGVPYQYQQPDISMPAIMNSQSRPASIQAIRQYFCSEYACIQTLL